MNPAETKAKLATIDLHQLAMSLQTAPYAFETTGFCDLKICELAELLRELAVLRKKVTMLRYTESLQIQLRQYQMAYPDAKVGMAGPAVSVPAVVMVPKGEWAEIEKLYEPIVTGLRENEIQERHQSWHDPVEISMGHSTAQRIVDAFLSAYPASTGGAA